MPPPAKTRKDFGRFTNINRANAARRQAAARESNQAAGRNNVQSGASAQTSENRSGPSGINWRGVANFAGNAIAANLNSPYREISQASLRVL